MQVQFDENIITPPPITRVVEELNSENSTYAGKVYSDEHGKLLKNYLDFRGFAQPLIEAYNNWTLNTMRSQLATYPIVLKSGETINVSSYFIDKPSITTTRQESQIDYPELAVQDNRTYSANVYVDLESDRGKKEQKLFLFKLPVMVGSAWDNLIDLSPMERMSYGFDPKDPGGWFVINGTEKIVLLIEKLRANRPLLYYDSNELSPVAKYTCSTVKGSRVITLLLDRTNKTKTPMIRLNLQFLGKGKGKNFPVFSAFRLLGVQDTQTMINYVLAFVREDAKRKVWMALQPSLIEVNHVNDVDYISRLMGIQRLEETKNKIVTDLVLDDLFPQIPNDNPTGKIQMLAILVARLAENMAGVREFDDRDSWSNKRIDSAAKSMEQLFMGLWTKTIDNVKEKILSSARDFTFEDVVKSLRVNTISDEFVSSFTSNNWGVSNKHHKENITDILKRDNLIATYSHLLRITITGSNSKKKKTKSPHIREVQQSGIGYICPVETPEGDACGITKNLAVTAYISIDREDPIYFKQIEQYTEEPTPENTSRLMVNGIFRGWCAGEKLRKHLISLRRNGQLPFDICINLDTDGYLYVYLDGSRPVRPLLIVDDDGELVIRKKNLWNKPFNELLSEGAVEYIEPFEQENAYIAQSIWDMDARKADNLLVYQYYETAKQILDKLTDNPVGNYVLQTDKQGITKMIRSVAEATLELKQAEQVLETINRQKLYTHCELDPQALMGLSATCMPMPERSPAPRQTYQAGMQKQALSIYHSNYLNRFDTTAKVLAFPTRPLFETQMSEYMELKAGQTVVMALMAFEGFNQEDAIIFNQQSIDNGLFTIIKYSKYSAVEKQTGEIQEEFGRPELLQGQPVEKYAALDKNGFPRVGAYVKEGDYIIGRIRKNIKTGKVSNASIPLSIGENGVIDKVLVSYNSQSQKVVKVKIRDVRAPEQGDKFASRYAQKGVIGRIVPVEDMPFSEISGMTPDIIVNPHSIPSRMTLGKLIEIIASKHASFKGEKVDATAFRPFNLEEFKKSIRNYGYNNQGLEKLISGTTGDAIDAEIFMGPCYYQALRHHVRDKIQMRDRGAVRPLTRTPVGGRSVGGGRALRVGEMEQAALVSHGASALVPERLCKSSDAYTTVWCQTCGTIAIHNVVSHEYICRKCGGKGNFGKVTIPYTFKVLTQYLSGIGFNISAKLKKEGEIKQTSEEDILGENGGEEEYASEDEGVALDDYSDNED
jgi:DNA-directed RNA polymerase II subunit RPB2